MTERTTAEAEYSDVLNVAGVPSYATIHDMEFGDDGIIIGYEVSDD